VLIGNNRVKTVEANLIALGLITPFFLGSVFLLIDIPFFNNVNPFFLTFAVLGLILGLVFGLFAGRWYTKTQLKILEKSNGFKGVGSIKITITLFVGTAIFLICAFLIYFFEMSLLTPSLALFVISGTFTFIISRIYLVNMWEKREEKIMMQGYNRFYAIPYPPPN
jgi:hypothetical protein